MNKIVVGKRRNPRNFLAKLADDFVLSKQTKFRLNNYGVPEPNIVKVLYSTSKTFLKRPTDFEKTVEKVKEMGFNPPSMSFVLAVTVLNFMPKSSWDRKLDVYKKWGWSEKEVIEAFRKNPSYMIVSEEKTVRRMDFLVKGMGFHLCYCQAPPCFNTKLKEEDCSEGFVC